MPEAREITVDGERLAAGWLAVAKASSTDKERPVLDRTVYLEFFAKGVQIVATDGFIMLRSWVSLTQYEAPQPSQAPIGTVLVRDTHGRAKQLMGYLLSLATAKDAERVEVRLAVEGVEGDLALDGTEKQWLVIELPDHERLLLEAIEMEYVTWRALFAAFEPHETSVIGLSTEIVKRLAAAGAFLPSAPLRWSFGGPESMALIDYGESDPKVWGLVMPVRLGFGAPAPDQQTIDGDASVTQGPWPGSGDDPAAGDDAEDDTPIIDPEGPATVDPDGDFIEGLRAGLRDDHPAGSGAGTDTQEEA